MIENSFQRGNRNRITLVLAIAITGFTLSVHAQSGSPYLTLEQVERFALSDEPGLLGRQYQAQARMEQSIADGQNMDPKLSVGLFNLPTDTFDFDQEAMTQLKVSYMQQFPSGDTLQIKQQKSRRQSELVNIDMRLRELDILRRVRLAYLEVVYLEQAKKTIQKNTRLFEQLVEIVQSLFSVGHNNQQDLIRAQLGVSRLEDRLSKIDQQINIQRARLARWIGIENSLLPLADKLPQIISAALVEEVDDTSQLFLSHPKVQNVDKQLLIARNNIQLVDESTKPGYALNLSYAYRDDAPNGNDRADFLSAAVTFNLPVFTENRQDRQRLAKEHEYQALKNKRLDVLQQLTADYQQQQRDETLLIRRQLLYTSALLPQSRQQSEASLLAYQSDRGSFSDVMRAYMDDLNAHLDERRIAIDILKTRVRLLYLLPASQDLTE